MNAEDPAPVRVYRAAQLSIEPQAQRRRHLYRSDPIWRLTKNKQNREDRLRAKRKEMSL